MGWFDQPCSEGRCCPCGQCSDPLCVSSLQRDVPLLPLVPGTTNPSHAVWLLLRNNSHTVLAVFKCSRSVEEQIQTLWVGHSVKGRSLGWNMAFPKQSKCDNLSYYGLMSSWGHSWIIFKSPRQLDEVPEDWKESKCHFRRIWVPTGLAASPWLQGRSWSRWAWKPFPGIVRTRRCLDLVSMDLWKRNASSLGWSTREITCLRSCLRLWL